MLENISEKIIVLRKKSGITQQELGSKLGISNRAVSNWEMQISYPSIENLYRLSKIFNVPMEYFLANEEMENIERKAINGMQSITELYKIGKGPSSSHTIGPEKACLIFKNKNSDADSFKAVLYGSLAKTGEGHGTDRVIKSTLSPKKCEVVFELTKTDIPHPNTMDIFAYKNGEICDEARVLSVGGGNILMENYPYKEPPLIYELNSFESIKEYCLKKGIRLWQYAEERENPDFTEYMFNIWEAMKKSIKKGLQDEGVLPGGLNVQKKAKVLFNMEHIDESAEVRENRLICSYAFAVSEQNAAGETIVTAPTCGASGVLPAVMYYQQLKRGLSDMEIVHALMSAGIVGNLIKTNASISGAECGCQSEIGSACAMTAAALGELFGLNMDKIEYAAEIAIEHHLGLTCDPICGLVQIPCIERNAVAAMRALNAVNLASFLSETRKISLDKVIKTMKETGLDISSRYKETAEGGLAKIRLH